MARGPFQGTYQAGIRPTVVTAPDALVYINGESDILGCRKCKRRFDWNRYITSIQVDLNVDAPPGSATVNLSIPRHSVDEFYYDGEPLIIPMMEIEIYAKGYYLIEGVPQYYPIFWGLVTEVTDDYSGGQHTMVINCSDILKWWEVCKMNINPSMTAAVGSQLGKTIFGNAFNGMNPYDIIWTLAQQSFGDVVVGTGSLTSLYREQQQSKTFATAFADIMAYWNDRFSKIRSNLLLYGTTGNVVRGDVLLQAYHSNKPANLRNFASQVVRQASGGGNAGSQMDYDPSDPNVTAFHQNINVNVNFWQAEYQTKLEIAHAAKEAIGFEFYMDVTGDIVFKPPFYNLDVISNKPVSWIQDIDVIDWGLAHSETEVITQIQLQGNAEGNIDYNLPQEVTPYTSVTDYHLLRQYGWRTTTFNSEFLGKDISRMFYTGLDMLDRINCRRHHANVTIPMRPELRLGFPIYLAAKDQLWYIQGISHNISFGGRATTSLSLTAKRGKFRAPKGIGSLELKGFKSSGSAAISALSNPSGTSTRELSKFGYFEANVGGAAQVPAVNYPDVDGQDNPYELLELRHPKTGRVVGFPNAVMAYTRPFQPTDAEMSKAAGVKDPNEKRVAAQKFKEDQKGRQQAAKLLGSNISASVTDALFEKHLNNRYSYGLNSAGVYTYLHDKSNVILEMLLLPAKNINFSNASDGTVKFEGNTGMIRPVSDERGFEVIGHHRYGRGVSLRDGSLVISNGKNNTAATIGTQLALSGGLFETLAAQSSGLTTISTTYPNPADAVARLVPDDLQTAATQNPDTKKPEYANTGTNFVDAAPLGSPEQQGAVSGPVNVEASQLSRALTLAEMQAKSDLLPPDPNCDCVSGRSDLAFINVGYQVASLSSSAESDTSGLPSVFGAASDMADIQSLIDGAKETGALDPTFEFQDPTKISPEEAQAQQQALTVITDKLPFVQQQLDAISGAPTSPASLPSREQMITKVEAYLSKLYIALDEPHQQYEQGLRGALLQIPDAPTEDILFSGPDDNLSEFSPPYSPITRALGGDPKALAIQGSTAIDQMSKAWSDFSSNLKGNTERANLQSDLTNAQSKLNTLLAEKQRLEAAQAAGGVVVGNGDIPTLLSKLQEEIDQTQQQIAADQLSLRQG